MPSLARDLTKACNEATSIDSLEQVLCQYENDFSKNSKAACDYGRIAKWTNWFWSLGLHLVNRKLRANRSHEKDPATNSIEMIGSIANDLLLPLGGDAFDVFPRFAGMSQIVHWPGVYTYLLIVSHRHEVRMDIPTWWPK